MDKARHCSGMTDDFGKMMLQEEVKLPLTTFIVATRKIKVHAHAHSLIKHIPECSREMMYGGQDASKPA